MDLIKAMMLRTGIPLVKVRQKPPPLTNRVEVVQVDKQGNVLRTLTEFNGMTH